MSEHGTRSRLLTWKEVAAQMQFSVSAAMCREHDGLMAVYHRMPQEYRQRNGGLCALHW